MNEEAPKGFEYGGLFYPWNVTTKGADLILIDRIAAIPPQEFFDLVEDEYDMSRSPVTLALIATSMRNRHPERSLERIVRAVLELSIVDDVEFIGLDEEEAEAEGPPAEAGDEPAAPSATSSPTSNGSAEPTLETLSEILA